MGQRSSRLHSRQDSQHSSEGSHGEFRVPYVMQATLGKGRNGVVYVAELTSGELETPGASRHIAVKKVPLSFKKKRSSQQISALRNEIEVLVHLGHQNLVKYFGWNIKTPQEATDQPQATFFRIFMEFCAGGTLQQRARKGLRYSQLRDCIRQILDGLAYIHAVGIVHGELTSSSIFLTDRSKLHLKIGGFGKVNLINTEAQSKLAEPSSFEAHNAPETQKRYTKDDPKSDIWNLAFVLIELLHEGEREVFQSTEEVLELIGGSLDSILMWFLSADALLGSTHLAYFAQNRKVIECIHFLKACLQKDPADRPTAHELLKSPHIVADLDEKELRSKEESLQHFTVTNEMTEGIHQAVDKVSGEKFILTKREVELRNWMDEFVAIATVVVLHRELIVKPSHPQMLFRTDCWACREPSSPAFVEKMTVYSRWDYQEPCFLLENVISKSDAGFRQDRVQNYTRQIVAMLQPIWSGIQGSPEGGNVVVLDLCSAYLLLNENQTKIIMLPFLFPEVVVESGLRDWFIAANIWDLGILVLNMLTGKVLLESREAGSFCPVLPTELSEKAEDFLKNCFSCFTPQNAADSVSWIRETGALTWPMEKLIRHPFLTFSV